jgi:hypothetical protein
MAEKKMTLYQIADELKAVAKLADGAVDEETGAVIPVSDEDRETLKRWFDEGEEAFDSKLDNYARFMKNLEADAAVAAAARDAMKAEMDRLGRTAKAAEAKKDRLRSLLHFTFNSLGIRKHKTQLFGFTIQNTAKSAKPSTTFSIDNVPEWIIKHEFSPSLVKSFVASGYLYEKDGPLDRGKLFYKETREKETELAGVSWLGGETLVVR